MNSPRSDESAGALQSKQRRILLFGDSHSDAIQRAIRKRSGKGKKSPLTAHRLLKEKNGGQIGDMAFETFLRRIGRLKKDDVVLSMIGGNQHAVFSTIQHPQAFDFFIAGDSAAVNCELELIPYRVLEEVFSNGLRKGDGKSLAAIREATRAKVIHIVPPPPKRDNAFIEQHHETLFAKEGLTSRGVSPPELRLKFWKLQARLLEQICNELEIETMLPPSVTVDRDGFLRAEYYAADATHANYQYGEKLIREIEQRFTPLPLRDRSAA